MWAFGCTCYEVLNLKPMFSGSQFILTNRIANVQLSPFEVECPDAFREAILQCLEAKPSDRPDALQFLEAVEKVKFLLQRSLTLQRYVEY